MKIIYNQNHDGCCAAAIISLFLKDRILEDSDFYSSQVNIEQLPHDEDLVRGETWYILGVEFTPTIRDHVLNLIRNGCRVVHIDHHQESVTQLDIDDPNFTSFYVPGESTAMLAWIYSCMNPTERDDPEKWEILFESNFSKLKFVDNDSHPGDIYIPVAVRYVHDYETGAFELPETKTFHRGLLEEKDLHPHHDLWKDLFTNEKKFVRSVMSKGT